MKKSIILSTLVILFSILLTIKAEIALADYEIGRHGIIQYHVREDGNKKYILYLFISDENGFVTNDVVTNVNLTDPDGKTVLLSSLTFSTISTYMRGEFIVADAGWTYPTSPLETFGEWRADIQTPLFTGKYTIEVTTDDAQTHILFADFEHFDTPIISSRTFQINTDSEGNTYWMWDIPKNLLDLGKDKVGDDEIIIRAGISSYLNDEWTGLIYVDTPMYMGFCFFPNDKLQYLRGLGNEIRFYIHVRNRIAYNRSYSKSIKITDFSAPLEIIPKKSAVVIPLF